MRRTGMVRPVPYRGGMFRTGVGCPVPYRGGMSRTVPGWDVLCPTGMGRSVPGRDGPQRSAAHRAAPRAAGGDWPGGAGGPGRRREGGRREGGERRCDTGRHSPRGGPSPLPCPPRVSDRGVRGWDAPVPPENRGCGAGDGGESREGNRGGLWVPGQGELMGGEQG